MGERLLYEEGKTYYKKGEIWLYCGISPGEMLLYSQFSGERLLYSQFSGGKSG